MGLVIGSIFPRGDSYPQTQQPNGVGTPVVAPLQPAATPDGKLSVQPFPIYVGPPIEKMTRFFAGCGHGFMSWEIRLSSLIRPRIKVAYGEGLYGVGPYSSAGGPAGPYGSGVYGAGPYGSSIGTYGACTYGSGLYGIGGDCSQPVPEDLETVGPAAYLLCPLCGYIQQIFYPASLLDQQDLILGG
jgi:hypothetical protein